MWWQLYPHFIGKQNYDAMTGFTKRSIPPFYTFWIKGVLCLKKSHKFTVGKPKKNKKQTKKNNTHSHKTALKIQWNRIFITVLFYQLMTLLFALLFKLPKQVNRVIIFHTMLHKSGWFLWQASEKMYDRSVSGTQIKSSLKKVILLDLGTGMKKAFARNDSTLEPNAFHPPVISIEH